MKLYCLLFCIFVSPVVFSQDNFENTPEIKNSSSIAQKHMQKIFQNYKSTSFQFNIKQDIFLSVIKTNLTSKGTLYVKENKFHLNLKGKPSTLTVFDGVFLWYQPDQKEQVIFKLKNPTEIQVLNSFFKPVDFAKNFEIKNFKVLNKSRTYYLKPKNSLQGLKEIVMKTNTQHIIEIRFVWTNSNSWQRYLLSKPIFKASNSSLFKIHTENFKVLQKSTI